MLRRLVVVDRVLESKAEIIVLSEILGFDLAHSCRLSALYHVEYLHSRREAQGHRLGIRWKG
jgi:hypothetical protein